MDHAGIYVSSCSGPQTLSTAHTSSGGLAGSLGTRLVSVMFYYSLLHSELFKVTTEGCSHTLASYPVCVRFLARNSLVKKNSLMNQVEFLGLARAFVTVQPSNVQIRHGYLSRKKSLLL